MHKWIFDKRFWVYYPLAVLLFVWVGGYFWGLLFPPGVSMLPPTVKVETQVQNRTAVLLEDDPRLPGKTFVITDAVNRGGYWFVSVAGFDAPQQPGKWSIQDATWLGVVTILDSGDMPGVVDIANNASPTQPPKPQKEGSTVYPDSSPTQHIEGGGAGSFMPFRGGTEATYGLLGVHSCGFSMAGWKAVDLFPTENQVYAAAAGDVSYVCRDEHQVALRIGDNLYTHLLDTGQQTGDHYEQGQALGGLLSGTFNYECGYADQGGENYHVHFCFVPDSSGKWYGDDYVLDTTSGNWESNGTTYYPGDQLTAHWLDANGPIVTPAGGANFWDYAVSGLILGVGMVIPGFPTHQVLEISTQVINTIKPPLDLAYNLILVNFNMTIPIAVTGIIFTLELARMVYASWLFVKKAIPFL